MASSIVPSGNGISFVKLPSANSSPVQPGAVVGQLRLPTDPIGAFVLTLTNLIVGSSIQISDQAGTRNFYNGTADASSMVINLQAYLQGSSLNSLRIKVRKGSASPYYQPYETLATAFVGSQSIYVSQIPDE